MNHITRSIGVSAMTLLFPVAVFAHGGIQKITEGKYLINFSSSPIAPHAGQPQQNIITVSDLRNNLITRPSVFDIEIRKDGRVINAFTNLIATGGLLGFTNVYSDAGNYEMFAKFRFKDETHIYEATDFEIQVNEAMLKEKIAPNDAFAPTPDTQTQQASPFAFGIGGVILGFLLSWFLGAAMRKRKP